MPSPLIRHPPDEVPVIPARDPSTLEQSGHYFILFRNPAHARTYQNHVIRLHQMARTYTPTSIESPIPLQPGVIIDGEDASTLLQDYALCPPSQRLQLKAMFQTYSPGLKSLLDLGGYPQLVEGKDQTRRSVLFWLDGPQLTASAIKHTIAADGREKGLAWDIAVEAVDTSAVLANEHKEHKSEVLEEISELRPRRRLPHRWIISFVDEGEARRFIRAWHRRPIPSAQSYSQDLAHAEFIW